MGERVYTKFNIASDVLECIDAPKDPKKDPCKVTVTEAEKGTEFTLVRRGDRFKVAKKDAAKVKSAYPSYSPPMQELKDFVKVSGSFHKVFGDKENPSGTAKSITVVNLKEGTKKDVLFIYNKILIDFISHGRIEPSNEKMRDALEKVIRVATWSFADQAMGTHILRILKDPETSKGLGPAAQKRIGWLINIYDAREKLWDKMKPHFDRSNAFKIEAQGAATDILVFLFANHILEEKGFKAFLYSQDIKEAATAYLQVFSKLDKETFSPDNNFYSYMRTIFPSLYQAKVNEEYHSDFLIRLKFIDGEYLKTAKNEAKRLLPTVANPTIALRASLRLNYGDTPERTQALEIMLKHIKIENKGGKPSYTVPMTGIDKDLRAWVNGAPDPATKSSRIQATNFLLTKLLERGKKMNVYWDKKEQEIPNFFSSPSFSKSVLGSSNNHSLEKLIKWARGEAEDQGMDLNPDATPHVGYRKWSALVYGGIAATGAASFFIIPEATPNLDARYYGQGASAITLGAGLGLLGSTAITYAADIDKHEWALDLGGMVIGGLLGGLIYGFTTTKPMAPGEPPPGDPGCQAPDGRCGVDGYGP